ncbi:monocarboxylate transporter, putative [Ixodes scapularis]|uniref:Monocarboxylate transporter, putative n=1 Tax=Ixodes scapularis TaxID=6945 RepID=B7P5X6_IXOSC|nr:monocarboxylate transporter, putative [Ixodes scapularis]|eukprot:XP_002408063.1 monocarboxylate transporter, putative [Ixodes scapularis]
MFYLDSLSLGVQVYAMTTFFQVYVDLAQDKGIEASQAIFLMHVYSISDFVVRVVSGVIIDRGYVELETVIMLSFLGCVLACEGVAWSTSLAHLLLSSFVYGASAAIVLSLAPSLIISDFKSQPVPVVLGGMMFFSGLLLLTRPVLVGYFRDNLGKYDGLMHTMAVPNALFAVIWCWKMISRRRRITIAA